MLARGIILSAARYGELSARLAIPRGDARADRALSAFFLLPLDVDDIFTWRCCRPAAATPFYRLAMANR